MRVPESVAETIGAFRRLLEARFGPRLRLLCLFGSYARGEAGPESDIDLAVVVDDLTPAELGDVSDLKFELEMEQGVSLGGLVCASVEWETLRARERLIALDIEREGIPF